MSDIEVSYDRAVGGYGDLVMDGNDLAMVDSTDAIQQHIIQRLSTFFGEWFLDTTIGVDYFNQILVKNPDQAKIDAIFLSVIAKTPGVVAVLDYGFQPDFVTRILEITFKVQTTLGIVNYAGQVTQ